MGQPPPDRPSSCRCTKWGPARCRETEDMLKLCKIVLLYLAFATLLGGFVTLRPYIFGHGRCCPSPRNACINNLKQLEGAKATWALEQRRQTNDVPAWSDIIGQTKYISF